MLNHRNRRWCRDALGDPALSCEELATFETGEARLRLALFFGLRPVSADVTSSR
jgi:hypothetical protein